MSTNTKYPFFSRAYGGYTRDQVQFIRDLMGSVGGKRILDPMAGQGFALSHMAREGAHIHLGDVNPATLLLASLRDPQLLHEHESLDKWLRSIIGKLPKRRKKWSSLQISEGWIAPIMSRELSEYANLVGLGLFSNPSEARSDFWNADAQTRFGAAIAVLAARDITSYRTSDNVTWLKPGGLIPKERLHGALLSALDRWVAFAKQYSSDAILRNGALGKVTVEPMNVESGQFGSARQASWIVTSPPYANRLDYTRLWAPEIAVISSLCGIDTDSMKRRQIGTTIVEGLDFSAGEKRLPRFLRNTLAEIREDPTPYSEVYYYPFFRNYAVTLAKALCNMSAKLRANGTIAIFVRDTVRKDVLFPTGQLVTSILTNKYCGLTKVAAERRIIRQSIGFVRKASNKGIHGLAQQEWWLVFRKPSRHMKNGS